MTEVTQTLFVEELARALVPNGLWNMDDATEPSEHERKEAERIVALMRRLLERHPHLMCDLGWQRIELVAEDDRLRRGQWIYAPPSR